MNDVAITNKNEIADRIANPFEAYAAENAVPEGAPYLRFDGKVGQYVFGADKEKMEAPFRLVVNMEEFYSGFVKWVDNMPDDRAMVRVAAGETIKREDLGDTDKSEWEKDPATEKEKDPWKATIECLFKDPESGAQYIFSAGSPSQINSWNRLVSSFSKEYRAHEGQLATIEFGQGSFKNRITGTQVPIPTFEIVDWIDEDQLIDAQEAEPEPEPKKPAGKTSSRKSKFPASREI